MKVAVIKCPLQQDLQARLNDWLEKNEWPLMDQVTHIIHANTHWLTIWYVTTDEH